MKHTDFQDRHLGMHGIQFESLVSFTPHVFHGFIYKSITITAFTLYSQYKIY